MEARQEDDVGSRVSALDFAANFLFQIVVYVLGFPESAALLPGVEQSAIDAYLLIRILGNELPFETLAVSVEQGLKRAANRAFVVEFKLSELMQAFVVVLDQPVARTDLQRAHKRNVARSLAGKGWLSVDFPLAKSRVSNAGGMTCESPGQSPGCDRLLNVSPGGTVPLKCTGSPPDCDRVWRFHFRTFLIAGR